MSMMSSQLDECLDFFEFFDYYVDEKTEYSNLDEFNKALQEDDPENGAKWIDFDEFKAVYNFTKRYIHSYKTFACEIMITFSPVDEEMEREEWETILSLCGGIVRQSLRKSDTLTMNENHLFLLLPELTESNKLGVVSRIRKNLLKHGMYDHIRLHLDSRMLGPDGDIVTWTGIAV